MKSRCLWGGVLLIIGLLNGCGKSTSSRTEDQNLTFNEPVLLAPDFSGDSAAAFIKQQLAFGPRVPGTAGHAKCVTFLSNTLKRFGATVQVQSGTTDYRGKPTVIYNIIGSFNPTATTRVMLSAHYDTRPVADADNTRQNEPIPGANDGGSGVAVLLEIARQLQLKAPGIGVDIFFWDAEDGGHSGDNDSWCRGSQYWGKNLHKPGYKAEWCINLDMVGAKGATFLQEGNSLEIAPELVNDIWQTAHKIGHGAYFQYIKYGGITDDHVYVYELTGIKAVDIIHLRMAQGKSFFEHWHTHGDDIDKIDPLTLRAVGQTVLAMVYKKKGV